MVGAIVLTLQQAHHVKRQDVLVQMYRDPNEAVSSSTSSRGRGHERS